MSLFALLLGLVITDGPLGVRLELPEGWTLASVERESCALTLELATDSLTAVIMVAGGFGGLGPGDLETALSDYLERNFPEGRLVYIRDTVLWGAGAKEALVVGSHLSVKLAVGLAGERLVMVAVRVGDSGFSPDEESLVGELVSSLRLLEGEAR